MGKGKKRVLIALCVLLSAAAFLVAAFAFFTPLRAFAMMQAESIANAGTWEDDPKNWSRVFDEEQPSEVKVIHSKYWRSDHFTYECAYYFEVQASSKWKDAFLQKRDVHPVPPSNARSFRERDHSTMTPKWFVPDPVEQYEVWDKSGYSGSIWINKTNGNIHFYAIQL